MHRKYLGDSYDAVKRLWQQVLKPWAPVYAVCRYIPAEMQHDFTRLTGIEMDSNVKSGRYSLLNDPDIGIRLPGQADQSERKHITIPTIVEQAHRHHVACVITFDQSNYRAHGALSGQRARKLMALSEAGAPSFYYISHAPFLFTFSSMEALSGVRGLLEDAGVPETRLAVA